ncbi:MAG: alpha/beta hydrolase [Candidatus Dormiibacterota bacterium]
MRSKWVDIDGAVHYMDWGGEGRPMVLVHGLGGSYVEWMLMAPRLAGHFRVVAPDLIGFGRTPVKRRHATIDDNQAMLDTFLRKVVREPVVLVGHSMGGLIAMLQAGRGADMVSDLVLIDPAVPPAAREVTPVIPQPILRFFEQNRMLGNLAGLLAARLMSPRGLVESALRRAVVDFEALDSGLVDGLVAIEEERIRAGLPYVGWTEARTSMGKYYRSVRAFDRDVVDAIAAPTLLIYGDHDPIVQRGAIRRMGKRRPGWFVHILDNVGHDPNFEVPERVDDLLLEHLAVAAA